MKTNTREIAFEESIENYLVTSNKYVSRSVSSYDKTLCLDTDLVLQFVQKAQDKEWAKLVEQYGEDAPARFLQRLSDEIQARGVLDVLRSGVTDRGARFDLAYFKPETGLNKETLELYVGNIFSVMRQVRYSERDVEKSIDMVLFLNGLPIFTMELKNQLTGQSVQNGMKQYQTDRNPKEPLLSFKRCLVHFAVDTEVVFMTTKLAGLVTRFLPFNKGDANAAGNPINPNGYKTAYVWEEILTKDSVLEIIGRFMHLQKEEKIDEKGKKRIVETLIFPRYHQLDTVRRLVVDAKESGAGKNYLIQHSAGSGKSNTIAWVAHRLSELHTTGNESVFDSVIVITDRRILDRQLSSTITQFQQTAGVVKSITDGSKELKAALESGEKIIVTTLQKFPVIVESIGVLPGKKFAVIIDEAHSSQNGESSKGLKQILATDNLDVAAREDDDSTQEMIEDLVVKDVRSRKGLVKNLSFFAFTATPKQKTLELFGLQSPLDGKFYPFSLYSMKQAIEEGFIVDVLKNYTTFQVYFALLKKTEDDPEFQKRKAQRLILSYVERHEHSIAKKVEIMVQHFVDHVAREIDGKAKAMIVTKSRLHAVRYKQAMDAYLREKNYPFKSLVAFSGKVQDGVSEYSEAQMNGIPEKNTAEEFKNDQYKFLIVAEKFQTGFDQPLLDVMYVDKKLGGVNAVQTLSRLNRTCPDKEEVFVLDFVNTTDDIKDAFQPYYTTTVLSEATDPNVLHDLERDIFSFKMFTIDEVEHFVGDYYVGVKPGVLNSFLDGIVKRFAGYLPEEQEDFRSKIRDYVHKYAFVAQIISYDDTNLEKLFVFVKLLLKKLPITKERLPLEVLESIDMDSYKVVKTQEAKITLEDADSEITPIAGNGRGSFDDEADFLSKIIKDVNDKFGTDFTGGDKVILNNLSLKLLGNESVEGAMKNNSREAAKIKFDSVFQDELIGMVNNHFDLYKKLDSNRDLKDYVKQKIFGFIHKKFSRKEKV